MTERNYEYIFEAEKNAQPGFKPFDTLTEALEYMEEGGILRATCNPTVNDRVRTRTIYMLSEKTIGLSEQDILIKLDEEVEKSLIEPMVVDYGDLKELSLADLVSLEGWLERRKDYWTNLSRQFPKDSLPAEKCSRQYEICVGMREGISMEISNRITKIFPDFEYSLDKEYADFV
jgi:hypothetical protein